MSSISGKNHPISSLKKFSFILLLALIGLPVFVWCQISPSDVAKSWKYESIYMKSPGDEFKRVGAHDIMTLRKGEAENTFSYALQLENIKAKGTWLLNDSILVFTYDTSGSDATQKPVIRRFKIIQLTKEHLVFREELSDGKQGATFTYTLLAD